MKLSKTCILFCSVIFFSITSCFKDHIDTTDTTEVSPSEINIGLQIKGKVTDKEGVPLSNVEITFYQEGKKMGKVFSDAVGQYSGSKIPFDPQYDVTIEYNKTDLDLKYRRISSKEKKFHELNVVLGKTKDNDEISLSTYKLANPSDSNLVRIWGYAVLENGTPLKGIACMAVWKYEKIGNSWSIKEYVRDISDANGYFELLVPKGENIFLNLYYVRYPKNFWQPCPEQLQDIEKLATDLPYIQDFYAYNDLGKLYGDYKAKLKPNLTFKTFSTTIKGKAIRCDGTPVKKGVLELYVLKNNFNFAYAVDSNYIFGPNGEFELMVESCEDFLTNPNCKAGAYLTDTDVNYKGFYSSPYQIEKINDLGNVSLCEDWNDRPDKITFKLGDDDWKTYNLGGDVHWSTPMNINSYFDDVKTYPQQSISLVFENYVLGINKVKTFSLYAYKESGGEREKIFDVNPKTVVLTINKIDPPYVYGSISGTTFTSKGEQTLLAEFEIYDK
jgi:hypothetical protein